MTTKMELYDEMVKQGSDEMNFSVEREPEPGTTFSREALDHILESVSLFIGARVAAHFTGGPSVPGPSRMTIEVKVGIDGESWDVGPALKPWYAVDAALVDGKRRGLTRE